MSGKGKINCCFEKGEPGHLIPAHMLGSEKGSPMH